MDNKEEEHRLIKHRKEKLERIKESRNPYKNNYARTHQCKDVINDESLIDNSNIKAGNVIVGLASFGKTNYEDQYNSGIGSNGLTSARHDVFDKYLKDKFG